MKALVTGTAGFIGSHLSERLLEHGHSVIGIDCFTDYYPREIKETNLSSLRAASNFEFLETSIEDAPLKDVLADVTHVFHLAAQAGVRKSWGDDFSVYTSLNVDATQRLLEACINADIERLVYASSSSIYGDGARIPTREDERPQPLSPYGVSKLAAEHLCMLYHANYGVPTVAVRYFTVYGPRQRPDMAFNRFLRALILKQPITLYGQGDQTRDFTFVEDAVSATMMAGATGHPGTAYNIGGGSRVSINDVLDVMQKMTEQTANIHYHDTQKGDVKDTYADTTLAQNHLGFSPRVQLEDGILAEYQWLLSTLTND